MTRDRQKITIKERICIFDTPPTVDVHRSFDFSQDDRYSMIH